MRTADLKDLQRTLHWCELPAVKKKKKNSHLFLLQCDTVFHSESYSNSVGMNQPILIFAVWFQVMRWKSADSQFWAPVWLTLSETSFWGLGVEHRDSGEAQTSSTWSSLLGRNKSDALHLKAGGLSLCQGVELWFSVKLTKESLHPFPSFMLKRYPAFHQISCCFV